MKNESNGEAGMAKLVVRWATPPEWDTDDEIRYRTNLATLLAETQARLEQLALPKVKAAA